MISAVKVPCIWEASKERQLRSTSKLASVGSVYLSESSIKDEREAPNIVINSGSRINGKG